jgi:nicotinamide mononucleotide transporter
MFLDFFFLHWKQILEVFAVLTGIGSTILLAKENRWGWFLDVINSFILIYIAFISRLYASSFTSIFYAITSSIAFKKWQLTAKHPKSFKLSRANTKYKIKLSVIMVLIFTFTYSVLKIFTQANAMFLDSINTSFKVSSQLARIDKKVESWLLVIIMNVIGLIIYAMQGLYITMFLYVMYFTLNLFGYFEWRKKIKSIK